MWLTPAPVIKKTVKPPCSSVKTGRSGERAGGRHARTGCVTCKIRHVKCDEEKPFCYQCRKTGRVCDGYPSTTPKVISQVSSAPPDLQDTQLDLARVDYGFLGSNQERHCFQFFECVIGKAMKYAFNTTHTHQFFMQAAHSNDAVKYAVVAIGSLGENLIDMRAPIVQTAREAHRLEFAGLQYLRAIRQLQNCISNPGNQSIELVLACCFLLIVFDFLGGDDSTALVHLSAGMDILRRCYPEALQNQIMHPSVSGNNSPSLVHDLFRIFLVVDLHEAFWLGPSSSHPRPLIPRPTTRLTPPTINALNPTLHEISTLLNYYVVSANLLQHSVAIDDCSLDTSIAHFHILAEKHRLLHGLEAWFSLVERYISMRTEPASQTITRCISLMRMNYHSILISLSTFLPTTPSPPSSIYTPPIESAAATTFNINANFSEIMSVAHSILHPSTLANRIALLHAVAENAGESEPSLTSSNSSSIPLFAFVSGAIQPLYLVATECQDGSMCETAIDMLEDRPWREGAWDGAVMARIARRRLRERGNC